MQTYKFDPLTKEFLYAEPAFLDPMETKQQGKNVYLLPSNSTFTAPPDLKAGYALCWNGKKWAYKEDHRQKRDNSGVIIEGSGTPYWLAGDTWETPARYLTAPGPLPSGAVTLRPEKSVDIVERERIEARIAELQAYLNSTDWYVIRYADTGQAIPVDVRADRQEARAEIDALREELTTLA